MEFLIVLNSLDFETVLGLWLWWFKGASKDNNLCVVNFLLHLGVRKVFVDNDSLDELGVLNGSTSLSNNFDKVEVDVLTFEVRNVENCSDCKICEMVLALAYYFGAEGSSGALAEILVVVFRNIKVLLDFIDLLDSNLASLFKAVCDFKWVDTLVEKLLGLFENCSCKDNDTGGAISNLIVLRRGEFC